MPLLSSKPAARSNNFSMPHTAGLSGDRSLDGAAIGTLVVIVDRAKNLPNLRSMGKQDPYCALRLGKEAKKTDTDKRGGQTPKWDQELRFTVYESIDYQKFKLSIFNEDKRTDLIGESWIELDDIIQRGGGQRDGWHDLNVKGRYAGQVRLEMTYYDTRPREEPEQEDLEDSTEVPDDYSSTEPSRLAGAREPQVKRRALPGAAASSTLVAPGQRANSVPMPQHNPRSYHTPPRQDGRHQSVPDIYQDPYAQQHGHYEEITHPPRPGLPDHTMSEPFYGHNYPSPSFAGHQAYGSSQQGSNEMDGGEDYGPGYSDDPSALEAVQAGEEQYDTYVPPPVAPLRHNKASPAPRAPPSRPMPPTGPPHSHSAPVLPPSHQSTPTRSPVPTPSRQHGYGTSSNRHYPSVSPMHVDAETPPPPPSHRNSAPVTPRSVQQRASPMQMSSGPRRALHHATSSHDYSNGHDSHNDLYSQHDQSDTVYDHEEDAAYADEFHDEPGQVDHWQQPPPLQPRGYQQYQRSAAPYSNSGPSPSANRVQALSSAPRPRPQSMDVSPSPYGRHGHAASASTGSVPLYRPRAISPNANRQSTPPSARKPVGSAASQVAAVSEEAPSGQPADIFSPDSFAQFNPQMSTAPPPKSRSPFEDHRAAEPMYKDSSASTLELPRPSSQGTAAASEVPTDSFGRIVRSDGRRVDPSDHLPSSTYAPEPEPKIGDKEKRANIKVNVKTRFGPRDAGRSATEPAPPGAAANTGPPLRNMPPAPLRGTPPQPAIAPRQTASAHYTPSPPHMVPSVSPLQSIEKNGRNRLQKRNAQAPSPLAPSAPGALNSGYGGYNSGLPPPVPGKVPLDAPDYYSQDGYYENAPDYEYTPQPLPQQRHVAPARPALPEVPQTQPRRHGASGYQVTPGSSPSTPLSHEISQIDLGPSPSRDFQRAMGDEDGKRYGGLGGRLRRSRFGA